MREIKFRAWNGEIQLAFLKGIAKEFDTQEDAAIDITKIENILFGEKLSVWQDVLGLLPQGTVEEQQNDILRKLSDVGSLRLEDIQQELQDAGFNVYLHVNGLDPNGYLGGLPSITYGDDNAYTGFDEAQYGATLDGANDIVVNHIDKERDEQYKTQIPTSPAEAWRYAFYIGAETFPNKTNVDAAREDEFRRLILELNLLECGHFY